MKFIISLCIVFALFTQVQSIDKSYNRLINCFYVCNNTVCDGLYGERSPNAQQEALCNADADAFNQCFNGGDSTESCLKWKTHLITKSREDFTSDIDSDFIEVLRECNDSCASKAQTEAGKQYVTCRKECSSSIIAVSLALLAALALLL